jgi:DNA-binding transcriptional LysR family regulator
MRAFVAVAGHSSFTEAARRLRLSPSVVTRSVAQLEDRLGLVLLNRTTRSVRLTDRGQIYLESCRRILEEVEASERRVRGEDAEPRGLLTVAAPLVFGRLHVLPLVNAMLALHEDLAVRLILSDRYVHLVDEGVDVAVRVGNLSDSSLIATQLARVRRVLVASPDYLARRGEPASPADLSDHAIIAFDGFEATDEWKFGPAGDIVARVRPRLIVNGAEAVIEAATAGVGVARAFSYQAHDALAAGRLKRLLTAFDPAPVPVSAVYPAQRVGSANLAAFLRAARVRFRDAAWD